MAADWGITKRNGLTVHPGGVTMAAPGGHAPRLLYADDVQALLGLKPDGTPRVSRWYVTHRVAPDARFRIGRACVWWEADVRAWLDQQAIR